MRSPYPNNSGYDQAGLQFQRQDDPEDFSSESLLNDNLMESPDMNQNITIMNMDPFLTNIYMDPLLSNAQPESPTSQANGDLMDNTGPFERGMHANDEEIKEIVIFYSEPEPEPVATPSKEEIIMSSPVMLKYEIKAIEKLVKYSDANQYWHVKSGKTGNFNIKLNLQGLPQLPEFAEFRVKFELRRSHPSYEHLPVNCLCLKHRTKINELNFPIIPSTESEDYTNYKDQSGERRAFLYYKVGRPLPGSKQMEVDVKMKFPCSDSCVNTDFEDRMETNKNGKIVMKEKSRFLDLCVSLQAFLGEKIWEIPLEKNLCIPVWIKAEIASRELQMKQRHSEKGAACQKKTGKRKRNCPSTSNSGTARAKRVKTGVTLGTEPEPGPGEMERPGLSCLVGSFKPDQEQIWSALVESLDDRQRNMLDNILTT